MSAILKFRWCMFAALAIVGTIGLNRQLAAQQVSPVGQDGVEVLTRGPLHEAFAETITFDPEPGIVVSTAPPDAIEEIAPNQRPQGANVDWIPGYWGWDDERNDFLWVSGIWRALPPGRQWVPGYWGTAQQGFQWTSGYWADAAAREIDYLPEPPASVETGPNIAAPSADDIWLPGSWIWQQNRYAWRPGTWTQGNRDWDWVPDHYVWTPSGYVFVDGYYDYSVSRRGVVFAPVYFSNGVRSQRGYSYSPSTVINPGVFLSHLFLRPNYGHYYFGDYYGSNYASAGFSPWFSFQSSRRGYDPIYTNQRWQNRHDRSWEQRAEGNFRNMRDNENARPPRNWAAQRERTRRGNASENTNTVVAAPLDDMTQRTDGPVQFQPVDPAERQQFGQRGKAYRKYLQQRQQLEATAPPATDGTPAVTTGPARRNFTRSPYVAVPVDQLGQENAPPQRHQVLKPDFQVQPQPRGRRGAPGIQTDPRRGTVVGPNGQMQANPQGQTQGQGVQQGNRQGRNTGQAQGQGQRQGNNRQRAADAQPRGQGGNGGKNRQGAPGARTQGQGANSGNSQQGASNGQPQGAPASQEQAAPPTSAAAPSE